MTYNWFRDHFSKKLDKNMYEHAKYPINENVIEKLVELLIKNGADINHRIYPLGPTPLHFAVDKGISNGLPYFIKYIERM